MRTLLRGGADVNATQPDGMTALENDLEPMDVLLYAGATPERLTRVGAYMPLHRERVTRASLASSIGSISLSSST